MFQEFLQIRKSSPLFRLQTGGQVKSMVSFLNNGPEQIPGLIVMRIEDKQNLDPNYGEIVVLINAGGAGMNFSDPAFTGKQFTLHPVQVNSVDAVVKTAAFDSGKGQFSVPRYSTAVFVSLKPAQPAATVPAATVQPQSAPQTAQQPVKPDFNLFIAGGIAAILILLAGVLAYMVSRKKG